VIPYLLLIWDNLDSSILNWELELYEFTPGRLGGLSKELLFAPRIDDKLCSWSAVEGLIEASKDLGGRGTVNLCALFDDEEIGSKLRQGAMSNLLSMQSHSSPADELVSNILQVVLSSELSRLSRKIVRLAR
jgi:aspartyl aminopeptidase